MIYLFLAEGFEEIEALAVVDVLRRAKLAVKTVGIGGKRVTGTHGIEVTADITEEEISTDELRAVVLPGGMPGTLHLEESKTVQEILDFAVQNKKHICAICAAPSILGHKGLLEGRRAVCYPGFEEALKGAQIAEEPVCVDGRFITGKGPGVSIDFALRIVEILVGRSTALSIRAAMQCPEEAEPCKS